MHACLPQENTNLSAHTLVSTREIPWRQTNAVAAETAVDNKKPTALPRWVFGFLNLNWLAPAWD
jgi:hypothetical protein